MGHCILLMGLNVIYQTIRQLYVLRSLGYMIKSFFSVFTIITQCLRETIRELISSKNRDQFLSFFNVPTPILSKLYM